MVGSGEQTRDHSPEGKNAPQGVRRWDWVDLRGIEPLTSSMPRKRAPAAPQAQVRSCAKAFYQRSRIRGKTKARGQEEYAIVLRATGSDRQAHADGFIGVEHPLRC